MKENSIEEDIKILEKKIEDYKPYKNIEYCSHAGQILQEEYKALEHILSDYKRVLKENAELRKIKEISSNITKEDIDRTIKEAEKKYISVQKIEDEIKELNKEEKEELKGLKGQERYFIRQIYQYEKIALQKLLKRED